MSKRREKAWRAGPLCLMWALWKERNERISTILGFSRKYASLSMGMERIA